MDDVLVDGVDQVEDFVALLSEGLKERGVGDGRSALSGDEEDVLLSFFHAGDVLFKGGLLVAALGGVVPEEVSELGSVGGVLVDPELEVLGELLVELLVVLGVLLDLAEHLHALLHDVLLDDLEDLVLLKELSGDVQRQVLGVHHSLHEAQVLRDQVLAVVHDEHSSHVQLDVVLLLLGLEEVERGSLWHEQDRLELELPLHGEELDGQVVLPIVRQTLVERAVLLGGDVLGLPHPNRLGLVDGLELVGHLLDLLGLLLFLLLFLFFDLDVVFFLLVLGLFRLVLVVLDLLIGGLLYQQLDREGDELAVLLDELFDPLLFEELEVVLFHL